MQAMPYYYFPLSTCLPFILLLHGKSARDCSGYPAEASVRWALWRSMRNIQGLSSFSTLPGSSSGFPLQVLGRCAPCGLSTSIRQPLSRGKYIQQIDAKRCFLCTFSNTVLWGSQKEVKRYGNDLL